MDIKQMQFITYCVGNLGDALNKSAAEVYDALRRTDILDGYIIRCYDTLHTFGKDYLIDDLTQLLNERHAFK